MTALAIGMMCGLAHAADKPSPQSYGQLSVALGECAGLSLMLANSSRDQGDDDTADILEIGAHEFGGTNAERCQEPLVSQRLSE